MICPYLVYTKSSSSALVVSCSFTKVFTLPVPQPIPNYSALEDAWTGKKFEGQAKNPNHANHQVKRVFPQMPMSETSTMPQDGIQLSLFCATSLKSQVCFVL
jgi:hypothetical protein